VHGEATSYLWYVRSPACSPSMHGKVSGNRIISIVLPQSDITVATLIEVIHDLTTYQVCYDKAWRAKENALTLLWGDWREPYTKVLRLLNVISYFNPVTRCIINSCDQWLPNKKGRHYSVLKRVLWCFPQCVASFTHCRPIVNVDATFLIGKYKGTLMVVVGMTMKNQFGWFANEATDALSHPSDTVASHSALRVFAEVSMVSISILHRTISLNSLI
jgi:hypothetical protein